MRLSQTDRTRLLNAALHERARRRAAYHRRRAQRAAHGLCRAELWVPACHAETLKGVAAALAAGAQDIQDLDLAVTEPGVTDAASGASCEQDMPDAQAEAKSAPHGYRARRRAQARRARARKTAAGLKRISVLVPQNVKPAFVAFAHRVVEAVKAGAHVRIDCGAIAEIPPAVPATPPASTARTASASPPLSQFLQNPDPEADTQSALFEDIHAADRIIRK